MLRRGELRVYDTNGSLQRVWPLPDVPSGGECGAPHYGAWQCHWDAHLFLEDAASGLVGYILDKRVHLLRLADGAKRDRRGGNADALHGGRTRARQRAADRTEAVRFTSVALVRVHARA